jgi:hypothetical protein
MVGLQILDLPIGVRVPVSQPFLRPIDSKLVFRLNPSLKRGTTVARCVSNGERLEFW